MSIENAANYLEAECQKGMIKYLIDPLSNLEQNENISFSSLVTTHRNVELHISVIMLSSCFKSFINKRSAKNYFT